MNAPMLDTFAAHLPLSPDEIQSLLELRLEDLLAHPTLKAELGQLNVPLLQETLPTAGAILATQLPPFYVWLKQELGLRRVPDGPDHTTRWVVRFLQNEESLIRLVELHRPVPLPALERAVPRLVSLFDEVKEATVREAWQRAIALLCLVLVAAAREDARSSVV